MSFLPAITALAALWVLGALLRLALGWRGGGGGDVVADFATGAASMAFIGTLLVVVGIPLSPPLPLSVYGMILALALLGWKRGAVRGGAFRPASARVPVTSRSVAAAALPLAAAGLLAWILLAAMNDRLWWDGWAIWALKAKVLFIEAGLPAPFVDPTGPYVFTHLDYPLAVPLLDWWVFVHAGRASPALASFMGAALFALLPLATWSGLRRRVPLPAAGLATLGVAAFWPVAFYAMGGTADVVIALGLLGGVQALEEGLQDGEPVAIWRAALFFTLAALSKNEGLALSVIVLAVGVGHAVRGRTFRFAVMAPLALPLLALTPWLLFRLAHGLGTDAVAATSLAAVVQRVPLLLQGLGIQLGVAEWMPLPLLVGLAALSLPRAWPGLRLAWLVLAGYLAVLCLVYLASPHDLAWLMATSLPRVLGALVPSLVFLAVLTIWARPGDGLGPGQG